MAAPTLTQPDGAVQMNSVQDTQPVFCLYHAVRGQLEHVQV